MILALAFVGTASVVKRIEENATGEAISSALEGMEGEVESQSGLTEAIAEAKGLELSGAAFLTTDGPTFRTGATLPIPMESGPFSTEGAAYYAVRVKMRGGTLVAFKNLEESEESNHRFRLALAVLWLPLSVVAGAMAWIVAGRTTRDLSALARQASAIEASTQMARLESTSDRDVEPLVDSLNGLLTRIEAEIARQNRLVADVAHDLRTPLTVIRGRLEMALDRPRTAEEHRTIAVTILDETLRLQDLSEAALVLGQSTQEMQSVDLGLEASAACRRWNARFSERGAELRCDAEPAFVQGSPPFVERLFDNLLENAIKHLPPEGQCQVETRVIEDRVQVWVDDNGPGVPVEERQRVFERFARGDASRARSSNGFGIGLASCLAIVESMGGSIAIQDAPLGGARLTMTFPIL